MSILVLFSNFAVGTGDASTDRLGKQFDLSTGSQLGVVLAVDFGTQHNRWGFSESGS